MASGFLAFGLHYSECVYDCMIVYWNQGAFDFCGKQFLQFKGFHCSMKYSVCVG